MRHIDFCYKCFNKLQRKDEDAFAIYLEICSGYRRNFEPIELYPEYVEDEIVFELLDILERHHYITTTESSLTLVRMRPNIVFCSGIPLFCAHRKKPARKPA